MVVFTASCGDSNSLVGSWECRDDSSPHEWLCELTFTEDGRFVDWDGDAGSWSTNDGYLMFDWDEFSVLELSYSLTANVLTLENEDMQVRLVRVD
jgi:hypothetical protein